MGRHDRLANNGGHRHCRCRHRRRVSVATRCAFAVRPLSGGGAPAGSLGGYTERNRATVPSPLSRVPRRRRCTAVAAFVSRRPMTWSCGFQFPLGSTRVCYFDVVAKRGARRGKCTEEGSIFTVGRRPPSESGRRPSVIRKVGDRPLSPTANSANFQIISRPINWVKLFVSIDQRSS